MVALPSPIICKESDCFIRLSSLAGCTNRASTPPVLNSMNISLSPSSRPTATGGPERVLVPLNNIAISSTSSLVPVIPKKDRISGPNVNFHRFSPTCSASSLEGYDSHPAGTYFQSLLLLLCEVITPV